MLKIIDTNKLKDSNELNLYQKFLKWKFEKETIREFNQDILRAVGENRNYINDKPRDHKSLYDGMVRTLYKLGYEEAMAQIEEMYDLRYEKGRYYFVRKESISEKNSD